MEILYVTLIIIAVVLASWGVLALLSVGFLYLINLND